MTGVFFELSHDPRAWGKVGLVKRAKEIFDTIHRPDYIGHTAAMSSLSTAVATSALSETPTALV